MGEGRLLGLHETGKVFRKFLTELACLIPREGLFHLCDPNELQENMELDLRSDLEESGLYKCPPPGSNLPRQKVNLKAFKACALRTLSGEA